MAEKPATLALWLGPLFWLAWQVDPIYTENQNTKFLQAIARSGFGFLDEDWLSHTEDGLPAFTLLSRIIYEAFGPGGFYLAALATHTLFLYCALLVFRRIAAPHRLSWEGTALFVAALFVVATVTDLHEVLLWGFSEQYVLDKYFQTADFGVFLIVGVLLFERRAIGYAVAAIALAALIHPAYVLPGAALIATFALYDIVHRDKQRPGVRLAMRLGLCVAGLALLAAIALFLELRFAATDPASHQTATAILTQFRIPHHADPAFWFNQNTVAQFAVLIAASLVLAPGALRFVIRAGTIALAVFVALAFIPHLETYRLIAPWRLSAAIVPLATFGLCAQGLVKLHGAGRLSGLPARPLLLACMAAVLVAATIGTGFTAAKFLKAEPGYYRFVRANLASGQLYLTPSGAADFRLATGAPQYVTYKSHPYQDVEVLEWYRRLTGVNDLYNAAAIDCPALERLMREERVTHLLVTRASQPVPCDFAAKMFEDGSGRVFRLAGAAAAQR